MMAENRPQPPADRRPPEESSRILTQRARRLARKPPATVDAGDCLALLVFTLGQERYAMEFRHIAEVVAVRGLTPVPCTPPHVRGIVNLRGRIIAVVDLKGFFGLAGGDSLGHRRLLILRSEAMEFALLVDTVVGVTEIARRTIQPPPPTLTEIRADYLRGVAEGQVAILDGARLLAAPWLIVDETVVAP